MLAIEKMVMRANLVPRVLSFPSPGAREGREGEDPGNEVECVPCFESVTEKLALLSILTS